MGEHCDDNRFKLIEKYKNRLIEATNIEQRPDEMAVIDSVLFRFWQMDWLDKLEQPDRNIARIEKEAFYSDSLICSCCSCHAKWWWNYCPSCGAIFVGKDTVDNF